MVRFEKDKLVIEVHTGSNPVEYWQELQKGLLDLLREVKQDTYCDDTFYLVPDFLRELIPEWDAAKKMMSE